MKNMVKDLSAEQLRLALEPDGKRPIDGYEGKTIQDFVKDKGLKNASLTKLMAEMERHNILWPFRSVQVTVEVTHRLSYDLAVLEDETLEALKDGMVEIDELDPDFFLEDAYEDVNADESADVEEDYAVCDDDGRDLIVWD